MVNHLSGHSTIYANVLACDETSLFGTEEKYHVGNVERIADSACRSLVVIGTLMGSKGKQTFFRHARIGH